MIYSHLAVPGFFTRPDGQGPFRRSTLASLHDSCPVQPAENSRARGPNDSPAALPCVFFHGHGQNDHRLKTGLRDAIRDPTPYSARKGRRAGSKDGLGVG